MHVLHGVACMTILSVDTHGSGQLLPSKSFEISLSLDPELIDGAELQEQLTLSKNTSPVAVDHQRMERDEAWSPNKKKGGKKIPNKYQNNKSGILLLQRKRKSEGKLTGIPNMPGEVCTVEHRERQQSKPE